jgi:hypothetical protein
MADRAGREAADVVAAYDFRRYRRLVDEEQPAVRPIAARRPGRHVPVAATGLTARDRRG